MRAGIPTAVAPAGTSADDDRVGADLGAVTHVNRPQDLGAGADDHAPPERGVALALVPGSAAERDAMVERAVVADFGGFADDHAHAVIDEHAAADRGPRVDLDAGQEAAPVREPAREPAEIGTPEG